jgi:sec-independent protein translocase protein TatA
MVGSQELILIMLIVLLLFGGKKIPELARGIGKGLGELQKGIEEGKRALNDSMKEDEDHTVHEITLRPAEHSLSQGSVCHEMDEAS